MALNNLGLGFIFSAKDRATPVMRRVEGRFKQLDQSSSAAATNVNKAMGLLGSGAALAAAGGMGLSAAFKAAGAFGEYEQELARVGAITRATAGDLEALGARAIKAGIDTQFSPKEAVQGLTELGLRGLTATETTQALGGALDFAAGAQIGVAKGAATTAAALKVFSKDASFAADAADKLLKISNITAIQGADLELMLGNVSRGAIAAGQSMDEMLISMGLVRNAGIDAAKASSAVSSGLQFIAKNQDQFKKLGIEVTNADGTFRNFLDIVNDTNKVLKADIPNSAERTKVALKLFGRFGVSAFAAISAQTEKGIRGIDGVVRTGADALAFLRKEMEQSAGTAKKFRDKILDTFEGQKTLLRGSMQTLAVTMGEAFATGFRPIVEIIRSATNFIISVVQKIPKPIKKIMGIVFVAVSGFMVLAGAILIVAGTFTLLKSAIIAFAPALLAIGQFMLIAGAAALGLVAIFKILKMAFDENIGGFGDAVKEIFGKVRLYFEAIGQLLSGDGRLRGDVLKRILDPANKSVLSLVQRFQQARFRVQRFFEGLKSGFTNIMKSAGPTFRALKNAFMAFAEALGFGSESLGLFTTNSGEFVSAGETFGEVIGRVALVAVQLLTGAMYVLTGLVDGLKVAWEILSPIVSGVAWVFLRVVDVLNLVLGLFGLVTSAGEETDGVFAGQGKTIGLLVTMWLGLRAAIFAAQVALGVYRGAALAAAGAQKLLSVATATSSTLFGAGGGSAGLVFAAGAAGYALGSFLDDTFNISDRLSGVNKRLRMTEEELNKVGETAKRGAAFATLEQAAQKRGLTVDRYLDVRSAELAKETVPENREFAQKLIRQRLAKGEDVFAKVTAAEAQQFGISGIQAQQDGQVNQARAKEEITKDAFAAALDGYATRVRGKRQFQQTTIVKLGEEEVARAIKLAQANADALDWEAAPVGTGT